MLSRRVGAAAVELSGLTEPAAGCSPSDPCASANECTGVTRPAVAAPGRSVLAQNQCCTGWGRGVRVLLVVDGVGGVCTVVMDRIPCSPRSFMCTRRSRATTARERVDSASNDGVALASGRPSIPGCFDNIKHARAKCTHIPMHARSAVRRPRTVTHVTCLCALGMQIACM